MKTLATSEVVSCERFNHELLSLQAEVPRVSEFIDGARWVLSRSPYHGTKVNEDPPLYFLAMNDSPALPAIALFYSAIDGEVMFISITKIATDARYETGGFSQYS